MKTSPSATGSIPILNRSFSNTRVRKRGKLGRPWLSCSPSNDALENFTGGFPATVIDSPSRVRICRRNCISLPGEETPRRKLDGNCPYSATQLLPLKKFRGISSRRSLKCSAPQSSMLVKDPLDQNTCESAVVSSGTRLYITSHSDAPMCGKRTPASALRYCPVMVHVHCLWMEFILFARYMSRAPLSPREGYSPGDEAVKRIKRQANKEVTTRVTQVVM